MATKMQALRVNWEAAGHAGDSWRKRLTVILSSCLYLDEIHTTHHLQRTQGISSAQLLRELLASRLKTNSRTVPLRTACVRGHNGYADAASKNLQRVER